MNIRKFVLIFYFRFQNLMDVIKCKIGVPVRIKSLDRVFLESKIIPYLNNISTNNRRCLFIGVAAYTKHYYDMLDYDVFTIDTDRNRKRFGNKSKHVVGSALDLDVYYKEKFDLIIANGLIGYGLNEECDFVKFLNQCNNLLSEDGLLVLGFNNNSKHFKFSKSIEHFFCDFEIFTPEIQGGNKYLINVNPENDHTYIFLKK